MLYRIAPWDTFGEHNEPARKAETHSEIRDNLEPVPAETSKWSMAGLWSFPTFGWNRDFTAE